MKTTLLNLNELVFRGYSFKIMLLLFSFLYLLFPNNNHLVDSLGYAGNVKFGVDLFAAHHLLYSYFNYLLFVCMKFAFPSVDAIRLMQFVNGIFALLCLFLLRKIILKQTSNVTRANAWTAFVGCSFGFMRFAVEAEVYIIPIFFSLLSSYYCLNYLQNNKLKDVFLSGLFASIACLFHQIHLFWGIGLFIGFLSLKKIKPLFLFLLSTPIVLIIYSLVLVYYNHVQFSFYNLFHFLAEYYFSAQADVSVGSSNIIITGITFFRTFFQVHGIVLEVLRLFPLFYLVIPVVVILLLYSIVRLVKTIKINGLSLAKVPFERIHLIIFILQFIFAFYSHGNSEFMVMLPFLMAFFIPIFFELDLIGIRILALSMLIWNFMFAIFPNKVFDYQNNKALVSVIASNPDKVFILKERNAVVNLYFYEFGVLESGRIVDNDSKGTIRKLKLKNACFCTDVFFKKLPYSRVDFTSSSNYGNLIFTRHLIKIPAALGDFYVDEVRSRD